MIFSFEKSGQRAHQDVQICKANTNAEIKTVNSLSSSLIFHSKFLALFIVFLVAFYSLLKTNTYFEPVIL